MVGEHTSDYVITVDHRNRSVLLSVSLSVLASPRRPLIKWDGDRFGPCQLPTTHPSTHHYRQHHPSRVVLMLLGTKMFPTPAPLDIIMDLAAHSEPFLQVCQPNQRVNIKAKQTKSKQNKTNKAQI